MITGQEIVERAGLKITDGQLDLFPDYDYILRNVPFKATGDLEFDRQWLIYWWMVAYVPDGYGRDKVDYDKVWRWYNSGLWTHFKYTKADGYRPDTNQSSVKLATYTDQDSKEQADELRLWLPYIKPSAVDRHRPEAGTAKMVSIFEHSLSYSGTFHLTVNDDKCELFFSGRSQKITAGLESMIDYIKTYHYYQRRLNGVDDSDDSDD